MTLGLQLHSSRVRDQTRSLFLVSELPCLRGDFVRVNDIEGEYRGVELGASSDFQQVMLNQPVDRKAFAQAASRSPYAAILFKMYDQQSYGEIIWKRIKPGAADPFRSADE